MEQLEFGRCEPLRSRDLTCHVMHNHLTATWIPLLASLLLARPTPPSAILYYIIRPSPIFRHRTPDSGSHFSILTTRLFAGRRF